MQPFVCSDWVEEGRPMGVTPIRPYKGGLPNDSDDEDGFAPLSTSTPRPNIAQLAWPQRLRALGRRGGRLRGVDLFSGCGGTALAVRACVEMLAYNQPDPSAARLLQAHMRQGHLDKGPITTSFYAENALPLEGPPVDVVFGLQPPTLALLQLYTMPRDKRHKLVGNYVYADGTVKGKRTANTKRRFDGESAAMVDDVKQHLGRQRAKRAREEREQEGGLGELDEEDVRERRKQRMRERYATEERVTRTLAAAPPTQQRLEPTPPTPEVKQRVGEQEARLVGDAAAHTVRVACQVGAPFIVFSLAKTGALADSQRPLRVFRENRFRVVRLSGRYFYHSMQTNVRDFWLAARVPEGEGDDWPDEAWEEERPNVPTHTQYWVTPGCPFNQWFGGWGPPPRRLVDDYTRDERKSAFLAGTDVNPLDLNAALGYFMGVLLPFQGVNGGETPNYAKLLRRGFDELPKAWRVDHDLASLLIPTHRPFRFLPREQVLAELAAQYRDKDELAAHTQFFSKTPLPKGMACLPPMWDPAHRSPYQAHMERAQRRLADALRSEEATPREQRGGILVAREFAEWYNGFPEDWAHAGWRAVV